MSAVPALRAAALAAALALAACGAPPVQPSGVPRAETPSSVTPVSAAVRTTSGGACTLPQLPAPGGSSPGALGGPAVTALRGGAAVVPFSLDHGALQVALPAAGQRPGVSAEQAECDALASLDIQGSLIANDAAGSGIAVGYGLVTISPQLDSAYRRPGGYAQLSTSAQLPPPAAYHRRLAWIVVFKEDIAYSCPAMLGGTPAPARPAATDGYSYGVFLVDAHTGGDALLYTEGYPRPCGGSGQVPPALTVPAEQVSVPWTLLQRNPDDYSATISALLPACAGYYRTVLVSRATEVVRVLALEPTAAACGRPRPVTLALDAATVTSDLPARLVHAPLGLYGLLPQTPVAGARPAPGSLQTLGPQDAGRTVQIAVGDVLVLEPLPGVKQLGSNPATSSNETVLGPVGTTTGPIAEFRGWKAGTATLEIPASACAVAGGTQPPCGGAWMVHVVVRG